MVSYSEGGGVMRRSVCLSLCQYFSPSIKTQYDNHREQTHSIRPSWISRKKPGNSTQECDRDDGSNTLERGSQEERQGRTSQVASHSVLVQTRSTGQKVGNNVCTWCSNSIMTKT